MADGAGAAFRDAGALEHGGASPRWEGPRSSLWRILRAPVRLPGLARVNPQVPQEAVALVTTIPSLCHCFRAYLGGRGTGDSPSTCAECVCLCICMCVHTCLVGIHEGGAHL